MKKAKLVKNNKKEKEIEKDAYSLKNLLLIILVLVIIFGIFYLITSLLVKPVKETENNPNIVTEIDASKITLNNLLNRKEKEYYVLATKEEKNTQINYLELYKNYIKQYSSIENSLPFYYVDLNDALNKNFLSDELSISNEISEIKLNDEVLFKIKDNKIEKYFVGSKEIIKELSNLKES